MKGIKKIISSLFGYTGNEKRSSFILIILIFAVITIRYIIPENIIHVDIDNVLIDTLYNYSTSVDGFDTNSGYQVYDSQKIQVGTGKDITELNSCDSAELESLPGLGPVLSGRIIKFRKLLGGFYSVEQLREVYGLNEDIFDIVNSKVKVDTSLIQKIRVNEATYYDLVRLPYLNSNEVNLLINYRDVVDKIESIDELIDNHIISGATGSVVAHYLDFK